jgi:hypothetical protein
MSFEKEDQENELVEVACFNHAGGTEIHTHEAESVEVFHEVGSDIFVVYENDELVGFYPREKVISVHKAGADAIAEELEDPEE